VGAGGFSYTLDIRESYVLGSLATVFQTEVYAILACSDYLSDREYAQHDDLIMF
jgi:hypothetical protein